MQFKKVNLMNQIANNIPLSKTRHQITKGGKGGKLHVL
jgi:hypothetical protein